MSAPPTRVRHRRSRRAAPSGPTRRPAPPGWEGARRERRAPERAAAGDDAVGLPDRDDHGGGARASRASRPRRAAPPGGWPRALGLRRRHARREPTLGFGECDLGLGSLGNRLGGWWWCLCGGRGGSFGAASAAPWATRTCHAPDDKRAARAV